MTDSTQQQTSLVDFLEACIAEDDAQAHKHLADSRGLGDYIIRILEEGVAKRAIIELHAPVKDEGWKSGETNGFLWCGSCGSIDDSPEPFPCDTLKALAFVYRNNPGYQQEWASSER